jgi:hypothetical protein
MRGRASEISNSLLHPWNYSVLISVPGIPVLLASRYSYLEFQRRSPRVSDHYHPRYPSFCTLIARRATAPVVDTKTNSPVTATQSSICTLLALPGPT